MKIVVMVFTFLLSPSIFAQEPSWLERARESTAKLHLASADSKENRPCTGFVIPGGKLVTCEHCIMDEDDCAKLEVLFLDKDGEVSEVAKCKDIEATNPSQDIAVIRLLSASARKGLPLAARPSSPGTPVALLGFPLYRDRQRTLTFGTVARPHSPSAMDLLHSAVSGPGNSGSPVIDLQGGEVVSLHCGRGREKDALGYGPSAFHIKSLLH